MRIDVKILGHTSRLRYPVKRLVEAAQATLLAEYPDLELNIVEIRDLDEISRYTPVMIAPGLVINEKLVYDLWIPSRAQVVGWLREALQEKPSRSPEQGEP